MKETQLAKRALNEYLIMGPERSLSKLAELLGHPPGYIRTLKEWSTVHKWADQASEYDQEQAKNRRREIEAERDKVNKEHLLLGRTQSLIAVQMIQDLKKQGKYGLQASTQLLKIATDLQRIAIGEATQQLAVTGAGAGPIDMIIKTTWGRNADARAKRRDGAEDLDEESVSDSDDR